MTQDHKGFVLVTGASAGIGAVYADRLARRGYDLILVARRADALKDVGARISAATGRTVETVTADLGARADLRKVEEILRQDTRITLLVNNAGVAALSPLLNADAEAMSNIIAVNNDALVRLSLAVLPRFVARRAGAIINLSSAVAINTELLNGVYSASKAFVLAFSQALTHELAGTGVRIQVVLPGATATDIWAKGGRPHENLPKEIVMQTEPMVDAALAGFDQGEFVTAPSLPDAAQWQSFDEARRALGQKLSLSSPAARYAVAGCETG
jgi:uncharacterized protein